MPANDPLGVLEAIVRVLETAGTAQPEVTLNRLQALLTLDLLSLPMQDEVLSQYHRPTLSEAVRRRLWHACNDLARWFAYSYEHVYGGSEPQQDKPRPKLPLHGVFARLFFYRGLQSKLGLFHYETWIPGSWSFLHKAYQQACARGTASEPFALSETAGRSSAESEYLQILLLQRVNSGNLTPQQLEWTAQWLWAWVLRLRLVEPPETGNGYWLDLGQSDGLLSQRPASPRGRLLYLDVGPLHEELAAQTVRLNEALAPAGGMQFEPKVLEEQRKLVARLDVLWQPQAGLRARRGERRVERQSIGVAEGWAPIISAMRAGVLRRSGESHRYSYDDVLHMATLGQVRPPRRDQYGSLVTTLTEHQGWQVHDTSESGARILSSTREAQKLQVGALLALQAEGDVRWQLGIVRRLRRRTAESTELGVEIITRHATLTTLTSPVARTSGYTVDGIDISAQGPGFQALYLPPQEHARFAPIHSLIVPATEYVVGRNLLVALDGVLTGIRLIAPLEQNKEWVWTAFDVPEA